MKKILSILFAFILLLSCVHISMAAHFCGKEIAAWKVSLSQEKATCGMCGDETSPENGICSENCCHDTLSIMNVDENYQLSQLQLPVPNQSIIDIFVVPQHIDFLHSLAKNNLYATIKPPGDYFPEAVNLSDICVFRI